MTMERNNNGMRLLTHTYYWVALTVAVLAPYFILRDRIGEMATQIAVQNVRLENVEKRLSQLEESRKISWEQ